MPGVKDKQFKSPKYKDDYYSMKHHQEFNKTMTNISKNKPRKEWTIRDQEFEDSLWAS